MLEMLEARAPPSWRKAHFLCPVTTCWEWGPRAVPASRHQLCPSPSEGAVGSASRKGSGTSNPSPRRFPHRGAGPSILMRAEVVGAPPGQGSPPRLQPGTSQRLP